MNTWPVLSRSHDASTGYRQHPVLDHGALTAGTIVEDSEDGKWRWAFVNDPKAGGSAS